MTHHNDHEFDITRPLGASAYETQYDDKLQITIGLPQLVWLRGDEPYYEEFSMDADQVMENLGIKRSRLNQISGKELRVGRTKKGRYIRPFYRPYDVEQYKNWVRPTATHKKSSDIIGDAAKSLEDTIQEFESILHQTSPEWMERFKLQLLERINRLEAHTSWYHKQIAQIENQHVEKISKETGEQFLSLTSQLHEQMEVLLSLKDHGIGEALFEEVAGEILSDIQKVESRVQRLQEQWMTSFEQLSHRLDEQESFLTQILHAQMTQPKTFKSNRKSKNLVRKMKKRPASRKPSKSFKNQNKQRPRFS